MNKNGDNTNLKTISHLPPQPKDKTTEKPQLVEEMTRMVHSIHEDYGVIQQKLKRTELLLEEQEKENETLKNEVKFLRSEISKRSSKKLESEVSVIVDLKRNLDAALKVLNVFRKVKQVYGKKIGLLEKENHLYENFIIFYKDNMPGGK